MSKTYNERLVVAIREILPADTPFFIEADPDCWEGYLVVRHPNGANTIIAPWSRDKRAVVTEEVVQETIRSIAYRLLPQSYYTPKWQALNQDAHDLWVAQTGIALNA